MRGSTDCRGRLLERRAVKSFFFTIYTPTIRLAIHPPYPRYPHSFRPAFPEIAIRETYTEFLGQTFADAFYYTVILKSAVEERGRKTVKPPRCSNPGCILQTVVITVPAPFLFPECHISQEPFHGVFCRHGYLQGLGRRIFLHRIQTLLIFTIGMNVGVIEEAADFMPLIPEDPKGVNAAGSTADME